MAIGDLPAQLFSPFKIFLIGLWIAFCFDKIEIIPMQIMFISLTIVLLEIFHNDYLRIIINNIAKPKKIIKEKETNDGRIIEREIEEQPKEFNKKDLVCIGIFVVLVITLFIFSSKCIIQDCIK